MTLIKLLFALLVVAGARPAIAQNLEGKNLKNWKAGNFQGLPYRLLLPKNFEPSLTYPLVVYLHGSGEAGDDNKSQIQNGVELFDSSAYRERYRAIVLAPQSPIDDSWGGLFYGGETETQRKVMALVDQVSRLYPVDHARRYLTGISMGAIGAWDMTARYTQVFAALVPIAGAMDVTTASRLTTIPIWAFHGDADTNVYPNEVREMFSYMKQNGGRMNYTEYPGVGHDSWSQTYRDQRVLDWMFQQSR